MENYREINLGTEAIDYTRLHLSYGQSISEYVLKNLNLNSGQVTTGFPEYACWDKINEFNQGGILPDINASYWKKIIGKDGKQHLMKPVPRFFPFIVEHIASFLKVDINRLCILENANARIGDPIVSKYNSVIWTFQKEVYHVLFDSKTTNLEIESSLKEAQPLWTFVGFMTSLPDIKNKHPFKQEMSLETIRVLAYNVEKIIVGAYDGEGFLIWNKGAQNQIK